MKHGFSESHPHPPKQLYVRTHHEYVLRIGNEYVPITSNHSVSCLEKTGKNFSGKIGNHTYDWVNLLNRNPVFGVQ